MQTFALIKIWCQLPFKLDQKLDDDTVSLCRVRLDINDTVPVAAFSSLLRGINLLNVQKPVQLGVSLAGNVYSIFLFNLFVSVCMSVKTVFSSVFAA